MRRLGRATADWISVDSLAHLYAQGILLERVRWAEIEQLVFSTNEWERRLVGSTIATIPFELPRQRRPQQTSLIFFRYPGKQPAIVGYSLKQFGGGP